MSVRIETEIVIFAGLEKIWRIFFDFDKYPTWNPFIQSIEGPVIVGKKITVRINGMQFKPTVLSYEHNKELCWKGNLIIPGLFDGEHRFSIQPLTNGSVLFKQAETFTGILVPLFKKQLSTKIKSGFESMNIKLRELSEHS